MGKKIIVAGGGHRRNPETAKSDYVRKNFYRCLSLPLTFLSSYYLQTPPHLDKFKAPYLSNNAPNFTKSLLFFNPY